MSWFSRRRQWHLGHKVVSCFVEFVYGLRPPPSPFLPSRLPRRRRAQQPLLGSTARYSSTVLQGLSSFVAADVSSPRKRSRMSARFQGSAIFSLLAFQRTRWHARSCAFRDKTLRGQASPEYQILPPLFGAMEPTACVCSDAKPSQSVVAPRARRKCPFVTGAKRCSTGDTSPQSSAGFPPAAEEAQPDRRSQIARRAGPTGHCSAPPRGADLSAGPAFLRGTKASGALPRSEPLRGSLLRARQPPSQENMLGPSLQWMESDSLQDHPLALSTIH